MFYNFISRSLDKTTLTSFRFNYYFVGTGIIVDDE